MIEIVAKAALTSRRNGYATVRIQRLGVGIGQRVTVEDNEPDDVFGPIFQRAAEEVGIDFMVDYSASINFNRDPFHEVVNIVRAE